MSDGDLRWVGVMFPNAPSAVIKLRTEAEAVALAVSWPRVVVFFVGELEDA